MSYPHWLNAILRCPETGEKLILQNGAYHLADGKQYVVKNGIASLVYPSKIGGDDARMNRIYNLLAPLYDLNEKIVGRLLTGVDMVKGRKEIVSHLELKPGMKVLEISPGPGVFQPHLREQVGAEGEIVALDLSMAMLRQCETKNRDFKIHLIHANAQHLPFADDSFDAVFHFGGINLFNDPQRAVAEFVRVAKKGSIVAWGDEGFSENYPNNFRKKLLGRLNPGFLKPRPSIPAGLTNVKEYEVYKGMAYLTVANKG